MKFMKYIIIIFLIFSAKLSSQSVLTFEPGTSMGVLVQSDLCANIFNGTGLIYGSGTLCSFVIGIEQDPHAVNLPVKYDLGQNYPNPFNPSTVVKYQLPARSQVSVMLFDVLGRATELFAGTQNAGYYHLSIDGTGMASGVYFLKFTAGDFTKTIKLSLIK